MPRPAAADFLTAGNRNSGHAMTRGNFLRPIEGRLTVGTTFEAPPSAGETFSRPRMPFDGIPIKPGQFFRG